MGKAVGRWGYNLSRGHLVARVVAALYRATSDEAYGQRAIDWLVHLGVKRD